MLAAGHANTQAYPEKPIRIVIGYPPGGQGDVVAHLLGQKFTEAWGEPVLVEHVSGAAGSLASDRIAKAAPDGYTLGLFASPQLVIVPNVYAQAHDPLKDFAPISQLAYSPNVLVVHNGVPATSVHELVDLARARPGELTFASSGTGTTSHMAGELMKFAAGVDIRHIPYKGMPAALPDLIAGRVSMAFSASAVVLPLAREGRIRALAVTSLRRSAAAPSLPTIAESGYPGFEVTLWLGLLAPAGTPSAIVQKVHREIVSALAQPDVRAELADAGLEAIGNSPDEFAAIIKSETPKWAKLIKQLGMKPD